MYQQVDHSVIQWVYLICTSFAVDLFFLFCTFREVTNLYMINKASCFICLPLLYIFPLGIYSIDEGNM